MCDSKYSKFINCTSESLIYFLRIKLFNSGLGASIEGNKFNILTGYKIKISNVV